MDWARRPWLWQHVCVLAMRQPWARSGRRYMLDRDTALAIACSSEIQGNVNVNRRRKGS